MNADNNWIVDSLNPNEVMDLSAASLKEVFACTNKNTASEPHFGAFDCAFTLLF
jgi:hypothetical protein